MNASPDILRDFSALQADVARLSKSNVELVNELLKAQADRNRAEADTALLLRVLNRLREERDRYLARALQAEGKNVTLQQELSAAREALRVCVSWAESVSRRVTEDRESINWTGLQIARKALADIQKEAE